MEIQSSELLDPTQLEELNRGSFEERERMLRDTENISESKHRAQEEEQSHVDAGKRSVLLKQEQSRATQERGFKKRRCRLKENNTTATQ